MASKRDALKRKERLDKIIERMKVKAAKKVDGLFADPLSPDFNQDALLPWKECSTATRAALTIAGATMADIRAEKSAGAVQNFFGLVVSVPKVESHEEWEKLHSDVSAGKIIDIGDDEVKELSPMEEENDS